MVVGPKDVIRRAHRARKLVGGGMRQAGILAAAGLLALKDGDEGMITRLADDHANARRLGEALARWTGIRSPGDIAQPGRWRARSRPASDEFRPVPRGTRSQAFLAELKSRGVLMVEYPHGQVRAVTHHNISAADIETTIAVVADSLRATSRRPLDAGGMSAAPTRPVPTPEPVTA